MKCDKHTMLLYAVTTPPKSGDMPLPVQVEAALQNGATCIQFRDKEADDASFLAMAQQLCALCHRYGAIFIVNDRVDAAIACGADGVHVGQDDMPLARVRAMVGDAMLIGASAHTVSEAMQAQENGADYLGLGAVFATHTKTDAAPMTFEMLRDICHAVRIPTVAIGGITKDNIAHLAGSGVDGVAVVSAIFGTKDPGASTATLLEAVRAMKAQ